MPDAPSCSLFKGRDTQYPFLFRGWRIILSLYLLSRVFIFYIPCKGRDTKGILAIIPFVSLLLQGCEGIRKAFIPSQPLSFAAQGKGHNEGLSKAGIPWRDKKSCYPFKGYQPLSFAREKIQRKTKQGKGHKRDNSLFYPFKGYRDPGIRMHDYKNTNSIESTYLKQTEKAYLKRKHSIVSFSLKLFRRF